jgi:dTDP-4-amino-4,6-dideoxygalactose transaminase
MQANDGPSYYEQLELGYNYRITDIQCALGISQLERLSEFVEIRRKYVKLYNDAFSKLDEVITPKVADFASPSWHLYILQFELEKLTTGRKDIFLALQAENIGVNVHYIPVYYFPYYKKLGYKKGLCPNSEQLYERIITLPLFPKMTENDVNDVIEGVRKVIEHYKI